MSDIKLPPHEPTIAIADILSGYIDIESIDVWESIQAYAEVYTRETIALNSAQPAAPVQDAVVRALIEAAQMAVEMIETEKHERRHVRWALKDALLAAKPADTEGRKDD